jgi:hypothetical protein
LRFNTEVVAGRYRAQDYVDGDIHEAVRPAGDKRLSCEQIGQWNPLSDRRIAIWPACSFIPRNDRFWRRSISIARYIIVELAPLQAVGFGSACSLVGVCIITRCK